MKIKLKEGKSLECFGNYQGFKSKDIWKKLNAGEVVEVKSVPLRAVNVVEELKDKTVKPKNLKKPTANQTKTKKNKKEVSNGK